MLVPRIKITEQSQSFTPVGVNVRNRILIVGEFSRGPRTLRYIGGFDDFATTYGSNSKRGSMAYQIAYNQGASEFALIRVLGSGKSARGQIRFNGITTKPNKLILHLRYTGVFVNRTDRQCQAAITFSGVPTCDCSGRLWFRVMQVDSEGFARVKFLFVPDGVDNEIDWMHGECYEIVNDGTIPDGYEVVPDDLSVPDTTDPDVVILPYPGPAVPGKIRICPRLIPVPIYPLPDTNPLGYLPPGQYNYFQAGASPEQLGVIINPQGNYIDTNLWYRLPAQEEFTVNIFTDAGRPIGVHAGVFISFGALGPNQKINLEVGDVWSVRLNASRFEVDIPEGVAPNQVVTYAEAALQGKNPLNKVERLETDDGFLFYLDEELEGALGNRFGYWMEAVDPDGEVIVEAAFYAGEKYIHIPVEYATYIKVGARVEKIEGGGLYGQLHFSNPQDPSGPIPSPTFLQPGTKVVKVEVPLWGNMAEVWLDKPISSTFDSLGIFRFANQLGLSFTNNTWYNMQYMTGGYDGPRRAYRDFYDLSGTPLFRLYATSEGAWGNSLRVTVYPITVSKFRVTIRDLNKDNYNPPLSDEVFNVSLINSDASGNILDLDGSNHVRGLFLPKLFNPDSFNVNLLYRSPMRLAPPDERYSGTPDPRSPLAQGPEYLQNVSLEDGYDGPVPAEEDYTRAIALADGEPVHITLTPGIWDSEAIKMALLAQAERASEYEGLRIAILNAPPKLRPEGARAVTEGYRSKRGVMVAGWCTYAGQPNAPRFSASPDAFYAGKLSLIPFYVGPHARTSGGPVVGVTEVDTRSISTRQQLQPLADAKLEVIHVDKAFNAYYFLTGQTLDGDIVVKRRTYDSVRMDLWQMLQGYKSEPLTSKLLRQISSALDAYFSDLNRQGVIQNYSSPQVSSPGPFQVEIMVSVLPIGAADYIDITMVDNFQIRRPTQ
jgi:hypothetical protein